MKFKIFLFSSCFGIGNFYTSNVCAIVQQYYYFPRLYFSYSYLFFLHTHSHFFSLSLLLPWIFLFLIIRSLAQIIIIFLKIEIHWVSYSITATHKLLSSYVVAKRRFLTEKFTLLELGRSIDDAWHTAGFFSLLHLCTIPHGEETRWWWWWWDVERKNR